MGAASVGECRDAVDRPARRRVTVGPPGRRRRVRVVRPAAAAATVHPAARWEEHRSIFVVDCLVRFLIGAIPSLPVLTQCGAVVKRQDSAPDNILKKEQHVALSRNNL